MRVKAMRQPCHWPPLARAAIRLPCAWPSGLQPRPRITSNILIAVFHWPPGDRSPHPFDWSIHTNLCGGRHRCHSSVGARLCSSHPWQSDIIRPPLCRQIACVTCTCSRQHTRFHQHLRQPIPSECSNMFWRRRERGRTGFTCSTCRQSSCKGCCRWLEVAAAHFMIQRQGLLGPPTPLSSCHLQQTTCINHTREAVITLHLLMSR